MLTFLPLHLLPSQCCALWLLCAMDAMRYGCMLCRQCRVVSRRVMTMAAIVGHVTSRRRHLCHAAVTRPAPPRRAGLVFLVPDRWLTLTSRLAGEAAKTAARRPTASLPAPPPAVRRQNQPSPDETSRTKHASLSHIPKI